MGRDADDAAGSDGDGDFGDDVIAELVGKSGVDLGRRRSRAEVDKELEDYLQSGQGMADIAAEIGSKAAPGQGADLSAVSSKFQYAAKSSDSVGAGMPELLRGLDVDLGPDSPHRLGDRDTDTAAEATLWKLSQWNGGTIVEAVEEPKEAGSKSGVIQNFGQSISRVQSKLKAVQQQFSRASDVQVGDGLPSADMYGF